MSNFGKDYSLAGKCSDKTEDSSGLLNSNEIDLKAESYKYDDDQTRQKPNRLSYIYDDDDCKSVQIFRTTNSFEPINTPFKHMTSPAKHSSRLEFATNPPQSENVPTSNLEKKKTTRRISQSKSSAPTDEQKERKHKVDLPVGDDPESRKRRRRSRNYPTAQTHRGHEDQRAENLRNEVERCDEQIASLQREFNYVESKRISLEATFDTLCRHLGSDAVNRVLNANRDAILSSLSAPPAFISVSEFDNESIHSSTSDLGGDEIADFPLSPQRKEEE